MKMSRMQSTHLCPSILSHHSCPQRPSRGPAANSYASHITVSYIVLDLRSLALRLVPKTAGGQLTLSGQ